MAGHGILRFMLIAFVSLYAFSYEGSCAKAETKVPATNPPSYSLRVDLIRRDSAVSPFVGARNLSNAERVRRAIERSHNRKLSLQNALLRHSTGYYSPVNYENSEFLMQIGIGSPVPLNLHFILDSGSDLTWTQCAPCGNSCISQDDPLYNPFHSSSFRNDSCSSVFCKAVQGECDSIGHCDYFYMYGDFSDTTGNMAYETFSLRKIGSRQLASLPGISFGCGRRQWGDFSNSAGIIGMGRGPLSLVSQLGSSINNVFSYCLGSIDNSSQISPLFLGKTRLSPIGRRVTPLVQNKANPSFYYLDLRGISVAGKSLDIPNGTFRIQPNGNGGTIIDSGTSLSYLEDPAYIPFLRAIRSSIPALPVNGSSVDFDLCYNANSAPARFPRIAFHFARGAKYVLPEENAFVSVQASNGSLVCLAFASAGPAGSSSIFGNIQQQNFHIAYDLGHNNLHFTHTNCASL